MDTELMTKINGVNVKKLGSIKKEADFKDEKQHIFIIGSKGIPANYGGFETFVENLTKYQKNENICYHVARLGDNVNRYEYNGAKCFNVNVPNIGASRAIYYDLVALKHCIKYCKKRTDIKRPIFLILACRIGPFIKPFKKAIEKMGGLLYINPDGHEWKRSKWAKPVRTYWRCSERLMVKYADLIVCDSKNIEKYIKENYKKYSPKTTYIAYGSEMGSSSLADEDKKYLSWLKSKDIKPNKYFLAVGRFVPENNYETMIREFMKSKSSYDFAIITTENKAFLEELERKLKFKSDQRIKFVGTVYDRELLKKIRENAYGYLHGHEVGGTNPSLLEALASTNLNLLLDVGFNREVGENSTLYWTKEDGSLAKLIEKAEKLSEEDIFKLGEMAKERIKSEYSWPYIVDKYESIFLENWCRGKVWENIMNGLM